MRPIRRNDLSPRVEMMPLIDVIFLLLTFFIYSLIVMVRAEVLPVTLTTLGAGQTPGQAALINAVTLDRAGQLFFNREPIEPAALDEKLRAIAEDPDSGTLYLALEAAGEVDRGPLLLNLIERVRTAGVTDFAIVGQPE